MRAKINSKNQGHFLERGEYDYIQVNRYESPDSRFFTDIRKTTFFQAGPKFFRDHFEMLRQENPKSSRSKFVT